MPIHPIGIVGKKGTLGCPYANRDYRSVNPEYGTLDDFKALVGEIHAHGMKCMIDVVYNHTSPDSVLYNEHPEFFYYNAAGKPGNKMGDWADVIDLDYNNRALWQYLTDTLVMWAKIVDGFRAGGVLAAGTQRRGQGQSGLHMACGDGAFKLRLLGPQAGHIFSA